MAATLAGTRLTEAHRLAQARIGAQTVRDLLNVFPLLDPADLDATTTAWLRAAVPIIQLRRTTSARLSANYLGTFRALELGTSTGFVPTLREQAPVEQLTTSLTVTGPVALKKAITGGRTLIVAADLAKAGSARAAMRHALNGGRDTIHASIDTDAKALGWARTTSGIPCAFCALLASRGPIYKTEQSATIAEDGLKYHDDCSCSAEPVYRADAEWPGQGRELQALWENSTHGFSGKDAINAFRRAYERPT